MPLLWRIELFGAILVKPEVDFAHHIEPDGSLT